MARAARFRPESPRDMDRSDFDAMALKMSQAHGLSILLRCGLGEDMALEVGLYLLEEILEEAHKLLLFPRRPVPTHQETPT